MGFSPLENREDREDWEGLMHLEVVQWRRQLRCDASPDVTTDLDCLFGKATRLPREKWFR
jgi:hypothetical protein